MSTKNFKTKDIVGIFMQTIHGGSAEEFPSSLISKGIQDFGSTSDTFLLFKEKDFDSIWAFYLYFNDETDTCMNDGAIQDANFTMFEFVSDDTNTNSCRGYVARTYDWKIQEEIEAFEVKSEKVDKFIYKKI